MSANATVGMLRRPKVIYGQLMLGGAGKSSAKKVLA
jgi:hypothetical protein